MDPIRTEGLDHIALTVSDLERSHDFYANLLGLERAYEEWHEPVFMLTAGSGLALFSRESHHGACHSIYFSDPDGHQLELTTYEV